MTHAPECAHPPGAAKHDSIVLRPAGPADEDLLFEVYASTRAEELAVLDWSDAQKHAFLAMQYRAQDMHYRTHFPEAAFEVIELRGRAAGRLYVDRWKDEIRILDIALLPEHRGCGVGTALLRTLQAEAGSTDRRLILHVEHNNPARDFYLRLGFAPAEELGAHVRMEWTATGTSQREAASS